MFTGIVETLATIREIRKDGTNVHYDIQSAITHELRVDQSVAHNGVCLTVVSVNNDIYTVTAVAETIAKTTLGAWQRGDRINLERSLKVGDRLDGHFVQGHVDTAALCTEKRTLEGSWLYRFSFPEEFAALVIEKGSICINGVSLTVFDVSMNECTVTIIPYTYEHTNFNTLKAGDNVNVEFDVLGKYFLRKQDLSKL